MVITVYKLFVNYEKKIIRVDNKPSDILCKLKLDKFHLSLKEESPP